MSPIITRPATPPPGGSQGAPGTSFFVLTSEPPSNTLGHDGDEALIKGNGNLYKKVGGAWATDGAFSIPTLVVQDEDVDLPVRGRIDFRGAGVSAVDDAGTGRTVVNVSAPSGGSSGVKWPLRERPLVAVRPQTGDSQRSAPWLLASTVQQNNGLDPVTGLPVTGQQSRLWYDTPGGLDAACFRFPNWYVQGGFDGANVTTGSGAGRTSPITISFAVEIPPLRAPFGGAANPMQGTFNDGDTTILIPSGKTADSDFMQINSPVGGGFFLRLFVRFDPADLPAPAGDGSYAYGGFPSFESISGSAHAFAKPSGEGTTQSTDEVDQTMATGSLVARPGRTVSSSTLCYRPIGVFAQEMPRAMPYRPLAIIGDSHFSPELSYVWMALGKSVPAYDLAHSTETAQSFLGYGTNTTSVQRRRWLRGVLSAWIDYLVNDLSGGTSWTVSSFFAQRDKPLMDMLRSRGLDTLIRNTCTPSTKRINSGLPFTPSNQYPDPARTANEQFRLDYNAALRSGNPSVAGFDHIFDAATAVEVVQAGVPTLNPDGTPNFSVTQSYHVWNVDAQGNAMTDDGLHPNDAGKAVLTRLFNLAWLAF